MELELIKGVQSTLSEAPKVITDNLRSRDNAVRYGTDLLNAIQQGGMNQESDLKCSEFVKKAKETIKAIEQRRKPITQIIDEVKKVFTGAEKEIKDIADKVQEERNKYAARLLREQQERERQERERKEKDQDLINIRQAAVESISSAYINEVAFRKNELHDYFNGLTLETVDQSTEVLERWNTTLSPAYANKVAINATRFHSQEEVKAEFGNVYRSTFEEYKESFKREIDVVISVLIDRVRSKRAELERIAQASEEERVRLENQIAERERQNRERLEKERANREEQERVWAKAAADAEKANSIASGLFAQPAPFVAAKENCTIEILNVAGYAALFSLWFEHEGYKLSAEKFERFTFERIRKFCEKHANDTGEVIESGHLNYTTSVKAR